MTIRSAAWLLLGVCTSAGPALGQTAVADSARAPAVAASARAPAPEATTAPIAPNSAAAAPRDRLLPPTWQMVGAGLLVVATLPLDATVREELHAERDPSLGSLSHYSSMLATPEVAVPMIVATWGLGHVVHAPEMVRVAERQAVSAVLAGGVVAVAKVAFGRPRPSTGLGRGDLRPGSLASPHQSFPSGHAAGAFAIAVAAAEETRDPVIATIALGGATAVGWSRIYRDAHWASDVVAGALVGALSAHVAGRLLAPHDASLFVGADAIGLRVPVGGPGSRPAAEPIPEPTVR